jgi:UDP-glucose 4-epimerase
MSTPRRLLILGHSGYIGSALVRRFTAGPLSLDIDGRSLPRPDLTVDEDAAALAPLLTPDTIVIVCAAIKKQLGDTRETLAQNLAIATNLCRVLEAHPVGRCVFFSSAAVYGEDIENTAISEATPVCPTSYYGIGKYTAERLFAKAFAARPETLLMLRPALVYGPRERGTFYGPSGFLRAAIAGQPITLWGDGTERREFVFIDDLVEIVHRLTLSDRHGVLNIVSGVSRTFAEAFDVVSSLVGARPTMTSRARSKAKVDHGFDNRLLRDALPDVTFTTLEEGLRRTLAAEQLSAEARA